MQATTGTPTRLAEPGSRAAIAGLVFSVLYLASFIAVRELPQATWSDDEIVDYYASADVEYLKVVTLFVVMGDTILVVFALRAAAVFMLAGTTRALRAGLFPRWFAVISYTLALLLVLTVAEARPVALVFPLWIGVSSILILVRHERPLLEREA